MNTNLLTHASSVAQVEQLYFAPVAVIPPPISQSISTIYCFLAHIDPWENETSPPTPTEDQKYFKKVFKSIFVAKQVKTTDISPVTERIDWTENTTYDFYRDDVNMFEENLDGTFVRKFYVKNKYEQIFKCLWNNNGEPSTAEPYFEPGSYGTNNIFIGSDGYKWKYMYSIDLGLKTKFMDINWIPVPVGANTPNPISSAAGYGDIEVINVVDGGSGYDQANATITITIDGDGTGAAAHAITSDGNITNIVVDNAGTNYTTANVTIISDLGTNASAIAPISPMGGHAFDPVSELGVSRVMLTSTFTGNENGYIPTDITYRQIGLIFNPTTKSNYIDGTAYTANGDIYGASTDLVVASGFGEYISDEIAYQNDASGNKIFSATILSFDPASNVVNLINIQGTPTLNYPVLGSVSKTARTLLSVNYPDFVPSGYLAYIENRTGVERSVDGIEQFKFVLRYN
jgi:hypothetical protein